MRNLVESKKIYSNKIINLMYIKIYEGIYSIYSESLKVSNSNTILQIFQKFLKKILTWEESTLELEKIRIFGSNLELVKKILRAISKINIKILLDINDELDINDKILNIFIHNVYKLVYVQIWDNPFLFYHELEPEIIKKNQRDVYIIIKECINRAIEELVDLNSVVDKFLMLDLDVENKKIDEILIKVNNLETRLNISQSGGNNINISEILNNNNIKISDSNINDNNKPNKNTFTSNNIDTANTANIVNSIDNQKRSDDKTEKTIDSKIENIIENDLKMSETSEMDSDDDGKKSYKPEDSEQYQEVFSNSEIIKSSANSMNSVQKGENLKRNKFFSNYLSF